MTASAPAFLTMLGAMICGCSPRGQDLEVVEGVVLLDGIPVEGALILFSPATSAGATAAGLPAAGRTGRDGTFHLNAVGGARSGAGTKVGDYVVTILKQEGDPLRAGAADGPPPPPPIDIKLRDLIPAVYKLGSTSPLRATVKRGKNVFRFELDSSARVSNTP